MLILKDRLQVTMPGRLAGSALAAAEAGAVAAAGAGADACGAGALQYLIGQSAAALETMKFGKTVRILRPGMAVTMDYRADRLNIAVDANGRIERVYCS